MSLNGCDVALGQSTPPGIHGDRNSHCFVIAKQLNGFHSKFILLVSHIYILQTMVEGCVPGWTRIRKSCYLQPSLSLSWPESRDHCKSLNSHLLVLEDVQELEAMQSFLKKHKLRKGNLDVWVGAKKGGDGEFYWEVCGCETYKKETCAFSLPVHQGLWRGGQPDNYKGVENWMELDIQCDAGLNDNNNVEQGFVCEYEL